MSQDHRSCLLNVTILLWDKNQLLKSNEKKKFQISLVPVFHMHKECHPSSNAVIYEWKEDVEAGVIYIFYSLHVLPVSHELWLVSG